MHVLPLCMKYMREKKWWTTIQAFHGTYDSIFVNNIFVCIFSSQIVDCNLLRHKNNSLLLT